MLIVLAVLWLVSVVCASAIAFALGIDWERCGSNTDDEERCLREWK